MIRFAARGTSRLSASKDGDRQCAPRRGFPLCWPALLAVGVLAGGESTAAAKSKRSKKTAHATVAANDDGERNDRPAQSDGNTSRSEPASDSKSSSSSSGSSSSSDASSPPAALSDKVGRFMANFKIGPAIGAHNAGHQGAIVLEAGWSVLPNKNAYPLFPLQFQFAEGAAPSSCPSDFSTTSASSRCLACICIRG